MKISTTKKLMMLILSLFLCDLSVYPASSSGSDETGITMYGFCLGSVPTSPLQIGPVVFQSNRPAEMVNIVTDDSRFIVSGEYANGQWYACTYQKEGNTSVPDSLVTIDIQTGKRTPIAAIDYFAWDMAFDYMTQTMYAVTNDNQGAALNTIDLTTGVAVKVAPIMSDAKVQLTLACSRDGQLYSIGNNSNLYSVNKETGATTLIGNTGAPEPKFYQSMTFDHSSGALYWATGGVPTHFEFYSVSLIDGKAKHIGRLGPESERGVQFTGLMTEYQDLSPEAPGICKLFSPEPGAAGALSLTLYWTNAKTTIAGQTMTANNTDYTVNIYRDGSITPVYTLTGVGARPGMSPSWEDTEVTAGWHLYTIAHQNLAGEGIRSNVRVFVGPDTPNPVENLVLVAEDGKARLTWNAPTTGVNGGWMNPESLSYSIVRYPGAIELADHVTETTYTDSTITKIGSYSYAVTPVSGTGVGASTRSNAIIIGDPLTLPWKEDFETEGNIHAWNIVNLNQETGKGWITDGSFTYGRLKPHCAGQSSSANFTADDWLFSPPVTLEAGKTYHLFWADRGSNIKDNKYQLTIGNSIVPDDHTPIIEEITFKRSTYTDRNARFEIPQNGVYYLGWHCYSETNALGLFIDDILLEEVLSTDMTADWVKGNSVPVVGKESTYTVTVRNNGLTNASGFTVSLVDENDQAVASVVYTNTLAPEATAEVSLQWTPVDADNLLIQGKVSIEKDGRTENDKTPNVLNVKIQSENTVTQRIGGGTVGTFAFPFNFYGGNSCAQAIYFEDEIAHKGEITAIEFFNDFTSTNMLSREVQVYMMSTNQNSLSDWVLYDQENLVYEGLIDFPYGNNTITIPLDKPFPYDGGNLLITTLHNFYEVNSTADRFLYTNSPNRPGRTFATMSNAPFDPTVSLGDPYDRIPNINMVIKETKGENINRPNHELLKLYPNPAREQVTLSGMAMKQIDIYTISGQLLESRNIYGKQTQTIDIRNYEPGIYLLKVQNADNDILVRRLIVTK
ncbi:MAG: choice-of-anchor J domain-containing protein [Candidatus Symbiothrix sp.]|jgi:hypothetical protein|nr:choice-of-anchor J domain-containing protein [Candidatus Symbiothrix sp.]